MIFTNDITSIFNIFIIAVIEAITEIFPISSTLHLILFGKLVNINSNQIIFIESFVQLGSVFSLLIIFKKKWMAIFYFSFNKLIKTNYRYKNITILHIFLSIFPIILIGLLIYSKITCLTNSKNMLYSLIIGTMLLLFSEIIVKKNKKIKNLKKISYLQAFLIGLIQCIALCPGCSRLGTTVSGAILLGVEKSIAVNYSFIIAIPILFGVSILNIIELSKEILFKNFILYIIGLIISFSISMLTIRKTLFIITNYSFYPFIIYRIIIIILFLLI
ncbi:UDP pyrophosphate phosphatase [Buchnera aphidicola (Nipponaphis monzeni)]|uniref:Undecaprenyl-diphosphatase n=1 Tax=Buchnera aphidicola (Nipponaphis monzeni) TaxID=2495405 RepID=A0A455T9P6_9GAMM|nr:undecaprenyl-diphosphate phosphatase [Buchnera aphidicola]BBI01067.1 UDP pyrophosphate phosphatase [Buchnera aphidicola (Nipponaphis monzeni)]